MTNPVLVVFSESGYRMYYKGEERSDGTKTSTYIAGYESPETFLEPYNWPESKEKLYHIPKVFNNVRVLDIREAVKTSEGIRWVFVGPLVNVDLPDNERKYCPEPSPLFASAVSDNEYGSLLALHKAVKESRPKTPGPLDEVSTEEYVAGWRKVGAKSGWIRNGKFVWDEERGNEKA